MKLRNLLTLILIGIYSISFSQSIEFREHEINSKFLKEKRLINVGLPKNYDINKNYPFVYILDGELLFDYANGALSFLANYEESIPNSIVIGISNTSRFRDMGLPINSKETATHINFINFIEKEVFPLIDENYGSQKFKILYGWSLGAQFSASIFSTRVDLFDGYILSGFLQNKYLFENYFSTYPNTTKIHKFLYASLEGVDMIPAYPDALEYFSKYKALYSDLSKFPKLKVKIENEERLNHDQVFTESLKKGMRFIFSDFFNNKALKDSLIVVNNYDDFESYNDIIKTYYKGSFSIPESFFINKVYSIRSSDRSKKSTIQAISVLDKGLTIHPNSAELLHSLSLCFLLNNNFGEAEGKHEMALKNEKNINNKIQYIQVFDRLLKRVSAEGK